jgi:hypothetical protein
MLSLFRKRHCVALSLFVRLDKSPSAYVSGKLAEGRMPGTYFISFRDGKGCDTQLHRPRPQSPYIGLPV